MVAVESGRGLRQGSVVCLPTSVICYRRTLVFLILPKIGGAGLCDEGLRLYSKGKLNPDTDCRSQISDAGSGLASELWLPTSDFWFLRKRSSDLKEHLVDALACTGDEGRGTLR